VTLFLMLMQVVIKNYTDFWRTLPLFLIGAAGMYWFWYRVLPRDEASGQRADNPKAARTTLGSVGADAPG
jgi:solute:Na+ symporter, SSS family